MSLLAATTAGAEGAPLWQLVVLGLVYGVGTLGLLLLVVRHRQGRTRILAFAGDVAGWVFRLPGWAALPVLLSAVGLLVAMWAGLWDIGYHIDEGRDTGPLGNPGHLPLLLGLFTTFAAGVLAVGMAPPEDESASWVRIAPGIKAPMGGVLIAGCMAFGTATLALDDLWHRVYGQDVTLWSPTHFVFLFGGVFTMLGLLVLVKEGAIARTRRKIAENGGEPPERGPLSGWGLEALWRNLQRVFLLGGLLGGMELFLAEYDYGVPLYRAVWQPLVLASMAALVFIAARAWVGRGAALVAWLVYAVIRASGVAVPAIAGVTPSSMPLLLGLAICVEAAALGVDPRRRPLRFGAAAGTLAGTAGIAVEYGWTRIAMPLPWTEAMLPEGAILAALGGLGGGVLGALLAGALRGELPRPRTARIAFVGALALLVGLAVDAGVKREPDATATVALEDVRPEPRREALATVRMNPPDAAENANWFYVLAWQGGEPRVIDRLDRVSEGVYRSDEPIPLHGSWKVGIRLNKGRERGALVVRLPVDRGLPQTQQRLPETVSAAALERAMRRSAGSELPAPARFTRPFGDDSLIVLRETKGDVQDWVWALGIGLTVLLWGGFVLGVALGLGRMGRRRERGESRKPPMARPRLGFTSLR